MPAAIKDLETELESMVDRTSVQDILAALVAVCFAKGAQMRSRQDDSSARSWDRAGRTVHMARVAVGSL